MSTRSIEALNSPSVESRRSIVIGTAGHIDHGKTTLIRALTGVDTDRLPEEKRRGITIDLGFASMELVGQDGSPLRVSFIDVPGHRLFVRNMLAGAGGIDAVMLVISADEGVKPQTKEHLDICTMLGVRSGFTVLTKTDAVETQELNATRRSVEHFLRGTFLDPERAPIVNVSARSGAGLDDVRRELLLLAGRAPTRDLDALMRLPIDRAFVMKGFGTVVTGTLIAGTIRQGQNLVIEPGNRPVRVRGLQIHGYAQQSASAGSRVAVNLAGVDATDIHRGETLVQPSELSAGDTVDVEAALLPDTMAVKHRARLQFYAHAAETLGTVSLYDGYHPAGSGSTRLMRLKLDKPIVLLPGDRFVLRHPSPPLTLGGGRVLDASPIANLKKAASLSWLKEYKNSSTDQKILLRVARQGTKAITRPALSAESGLARKSLAEMLARLEQKGSIVLLPNELVLASEAWRASIELFSRELKNLLQNSRTSGVKRAELKSQTKLGANVFDFALEHVRGEKQIELQGELIYPFGRAAEVPDKDQQTLAAIANAFKGAGLLSPPLDEIATKLHIDSREMRRLVTLLLRNKTLVKMGNNELYVHSDPLTKLRTHISGLRGQKLDVAGFKQLSGLSRKYAIPLLEYLDRERVTRKIDEQHRLVL